MREKRGDEEKRNLLSSSEVYNTRILYALKFRLYKNLKYFTCSIIISRAGDKCSLNNAHISKDIFSRFTSLYKIFDGCYIPLIESD